MCMITYGTLSSAMVSNIASSILPAEMSFMISTRYSLTTLLATDERNVSTEIMTSGYLFRMVLKALSSRLSSSSSLTGFLLARDAVEHAPMSDYLSSLDNNCFALWLCCTKVGMATLKRVISHVYYAHNL